MVNFWVSKSTPLIPTELEEPIPPGPPWKKVIPYPWYIPPTEPKNQNTPPPGGEFLANPPLEILVIPVACY